MNNRSGIFKTNLSGDLAYKSFVPSSLPPNPSVEMTDEMINLLIRANAQITVLNDLAQRIPNVDLFVSMYIRKEALMSSQIEGTQATLEDVLDPLIEKNTNQNIADVINYIKATEYAVERLKSLPLSNRMLRETHKILMKEVRGQERTPGEFRHSQNWIGAKDSTIKTARYIPPKPEDMIQAMNDLEKYIHDNDEGDLLVKVALLHYQFETIHPFLDGNGRIGRLLITLFLMDKKLLSTPALYISYYLKKNRMEYYDRLMEVRNKGDYEQWVYFFLQAVEDTAKDAISRIYELAKLHEKNVELISNMGRSSANIRRVFDYLESHPIIEIKKTSEILEMSYNTISSAVEKLIEANILVQQGAGMRNRTFAYEGYLGILRDGTDDKKMEEEDRYVEL